MDKNKNIPPVLLLIFNRPETTKTVFDEIRKAQPKQFFVAADGPRADKPDDTDLCNQAREVINVDWECDLKTRYRDENHGCRHSNNDSISWFFENVEEGIILEDDIVPSQSFFPFCDEMLERFREDRRVMMISGYTRTNTWEKQAASYFFSNYGGIWGWASWKRAWQMNDLEAKAIYENDIMIKFHKLFKSKMQAKRRYRDIFNVVENNVDSWAYHWGLARNMNSGLSVVPSKSLAENIGFGSEATHTKGDPGYGVKKHEIEFPLTHNENIIPDYDYDKIFSEVNLRNMVVNKIYKVLKKMKLV